MAKNEEKGNLKFDVPRILIGTLAVAFAVFMYGQFIRFLMDAEYTAFFRVLVFFMGQFTSLLFLIFAGLMVSKKINCPECNEGHLLFPLSDLYPWLPSMPFSPKFLSLFRFNSKDNFMLNSVEGKVTGRCKCCGAVFEFEHSNLMVTEPPAKLTGRLEVSG